MAMRITAEDPYSGFLPNMGTVASMSISLIGDSISYFSFKSGTLIHNYADSQIGHVFIRSKDRIHAIFDLCNVIKTLKINSNFSTAYAYLARIIQSEDFLNNKHHTTWLDMLISNSLSQSMRSTHAELPILCSSLIGIFEIDKTGRPAECEFELNGSIAKFYSVLIKPGLVWCKSLCEPFQWKLSFHKIADSQFYLFLHDKKHSCSVVESPEYFKVTVDDEEFICRKETSADKFVIRSPSSGRIVKNYVSIGENVTSGQNVADIESMKTYITIKAQKPGILHFIASKDSNVSKSQIIAEFKCSDIPKDEKKRSPLILSNCGVKSSLIEIKDFIGALSYKVDLQAISSEDICGQVACSDISEFYRAFTCRLKQVQSVEISSIYGYLETFMKLMQQRFADSLSPGEVFIHEMKFYITQLLKCENPNVKRHAHKIKEFLAHFESQRFHCVIEETEKVIKKIVDSFQDGSDMNLDEKRTVALDVTPYFFSNLDLNISKAALYLYAVHLYDIVSYSFPELCECPCISWDYTEVQPGKYAGSYSMVSCTKQGFAVYVRSISSETGNVLKKVIEAFDNISVLYIFTDRDVFPGIDYFLNLLRSSLSNYVADFVSLGLISSKSKLALMEMFTFDAQRNYEENRLLRNIDPELSYLLELERITEEHTAGNTYTNPNGSVHVIEALPKNGETSVRRVFIRTVIRPDPTMYDRQSLRDFREEALSIIGESFEAACNLLSANIDHVVASHLFINLLPIFVNSIDDVKEIIHYIFHEFKDNILQLNFTQAEVKVRLRVQTHQKPLQYRFLISNPTGEHLNMEVYLEVLSNLGHKKLISVDNGDEQPKEMTISSHNPLTLVDQLRASARSSECVFLYDYPELIGNALKSTGFKMLSCEFLSVQDDSVSLSKVSGCDISYRTIGMGSFLVGYENSIGLQRQVVFLGNDITFNAGAFGLEEDEYFYQITKYCMDQKFPRVFLSANSGAKVGIADEALPLVQPCFVDGDTRKGIDYLYIESHDYEQNFQKIKVQAEPILDSSGKIYRYKITDVVGLKRGIGVENLSGSGLIAGITSKAYKEIFTLSIVSGRSVGIGAYLLRLGQRVIQRKNQPIILTGNQALNKLLGKDVYNDNLSIGGPQIMSTNGISHLVVDNEFQALCKAFNWLEFTPSRSGQNPPRLLSFVSQPRIIEKELSLQNPRVLLNDGGLLDDGTFMETMGHWAKTVVTGRGLIGGFPIGIIATEGRAVKLQPPADPASDKLPEEIVQAGQVWYPDSAFKTASALRDFRQSGENLPVLILANWRGFSGGAKDMYESVLKFGSLIVDELVEFKQPVFVYVIGELRGGSWVKNFDNIRLYWTAS